MAFRDKCIELLFTCVLLVASLPCAAPAQDLLPTASAPEAICVTTDREQLILAPGEELGVQIALALPDDVAGRMVPYRIALRSVNAERSVWSKEEMLDVPIDGRLSFDVVVPAPLEEGVYTLHITALAPRAFQKFNLVRRGQPLAERQIQLVVFDNQAPPPADDQAAWNEVGQIEPSNPRWWQRLPQWTMVRRLPGLTRRGPSGSVPPQVVRRGGGDFIELPPKRAEKESHWQAFALPVRELGLPHVVEVGYPTDVELQLGFSILESDGPQGEATQLESCVFIDKHSTAAAGVVGRHRLVYWPRTKSPVLLVTNGHPALPAYLGTIRVLAGPARLAAASPGLMTPNLRERLAATYVPPSSIQSVFGVTGVAIGGEGHNLTCADWHSAHLASRRISDFLHHAGFNAVVVPLTSTEGGPPNAYAPPVTESRDTPPVDFLELLLRTFAREQLTFLPAVEFDPSLRDHVQQILAKYGRHAALGGVVVNVTSSGLAAVAGDLQSPDEEAIRAFEQASGIRLSASGDSTLAKRREVLLENYRHDWRRWRAERVSADLRRLVELVQADQRQRQVVVTIDQLLNDPLMRQRLRPALVENVELEPLFFDLGIDLQQLAQVSGLTVLEPRVVAPAAPLVDRAVDLQLNESTVVMARSFASGSTGAVLVHRGRAGKLASLNVDAPLNNADDVRLLTVPVAHGPASRQAMVNALAFDDRRVIIERGPLPVLGQEEQTKSHRELFRWLPAVAVSEEIPAAQPVKVRTYRRATDSTICVMNDSPWPVTTRVDVQLPQECAVELGPGLSPPGNSQEQTFPAGMQSWKIEMEPYDLVAARFNAANVDVAAVEVKVDPQVKLNLAARIDDLSRRDKRSTDASLYPVLPNPGFEPSGAETASRPLGGWQPLIPGPSGSVQLSEAGPLAGQSSLYMRTEVHPVGVQSPPFPTPPTGQIALATLIRAEGISPETQLRIVFETIGEPAYRRYTALGSSIPANRPLSSEGGSYLFGVHDLPLDSSSEMVLRFELLGPGQVWIDDLKLHSLLFPLPHPDKSSGFALTKVVRAARNALERDNLADCQQLLDGYWARFMEEYLPLTEPEESTPEIPSVADPDLTAQPEVDSDSAPSLSDRVRRLFWR